MPFRTAHQIAAKPWNSRLIANGQHWIIARFVDRNDVQHDGPWVRVFVEQDPNDCRNR